MSKSDSGVVRCTFLSLPLLNVRMLNQYRPEGCAVIFKKLVVGPFASNCYIVGSEETKEGMIIDPGDEAEQILNSVEGLGLDIKLIVLTHAHIDHIGAAKEVKEATGAAKHVIRYFLPVSAFSG